MTRTYPPLILGFWVLLAAALAFAILPRLMQRAPQPAVAPPLEGNNAPARPASEVPAPSAGQIAVPRSLLFSDGTAPRSTSSTRTGAPLAAPVPLVGVRPPAAFADRPGGIFAAPPDGR